MLIQEAVTLLHDKCTEWLKQIILLLPNLILAVIVIILAQILAKKIKHLVRHFFERIIANRALINFLGTLAHTGILLIGLLAAIKILQLDEAVFSLLAGVGIAGIALGFAFQDIAANFIAGMALVFRKDYPFKVDDIIETNGMIGIVKEINLRDTMIQTFGGQYIFVPNKQIFENAVINYSALGSRRVDLGIGVSYGDDLEKVKKISMESVQSIPSLLKEKPVELFYEEFGNSSINFQLRFWIPFTSQADFLQARSDAVMRIKKAYNEHGITIPFPIRTLDFGIKGGEKLSAMLGDLNK